MAKKPDFNKVAHDHKSANAQASAAAAKELMSRQAKGEKRKYTRLTTRENKTELVQVRITKAEYNALLDYAEFMKSGSLSECIRQVLNAELDAYAAAKTLEGKE